MEEIYSYLSSVDDKERVASTSFPDDVFAFMIEILQGDKDINIINSLAPGRCGNDFKNTLSVFITQCSSLSPWS